MQYEELFKALAKSNIRYLVCGGLAVNIYGIPRMTADIDLIIDFEKSNIQKLKVLLDGLNYHSAIPVSLIDLSDKSKREQLAKEKNMMAFSFYNSMSNFMSVDVLIDTPFSFDELWQKKEKRNLEDYEVYLASVEDMIRLKIYANRAQDQEDIILLSKLLKK